MKNKNLLYTFIALFSLFMFNACDTDDLTSVSFDYTTEGVIHTGAFTGTGDRTFGSLVMTSDLKQKLEDNNTSMDLLDELRLKSLVVSHHEDTVATFDNIEKLEMYISTISLNEVFIAGKNPVPDGLNSVNMDVNNTQDLTPFVKSDSFTFTLKGSNSADLPGMNLNIKAVWEVKASAK